MSSVRRLLVVFLSVLLFTSSLHAQHSPITLTHPGGDTLLTQPGNVVTAGFQAGNVSRKHAVVEPRVTIPSGWRLLNPESRFLLDSSSTAVRLLSVAVPSSAAPGRYTVTYDLFSPLDSTSTGQACLTVIVSARRRIDLQRIEAPRFAVAGETYRVIFAVRNLGNQQENVCLRARTAEDSRAVPEKDLLVLRTGESAIVPVTVRATLLAVKGTQQVTELSAFPTSDSTVIALASALVAVMPKMDEGPDLRYRIPGMLSLRLSGESSEVAGQVEANWEGSLKENGTDHIAVLLRTPDAQVRSTLGLRDEYRVAYRTETLELEGGDRAFALSPLTEFGQYAMGIGGAVRLGDLRVGGFVNKTRYYWPAREEQATFASYDVNESATVGMNLLHRRDETDNAVGSLRGIFRPRPETGIDVEAGISSRAEKQDHALALGVQGIEKWMFYDARYIHSGPSFGGYYRGVDLKTVSLSVLPFGRWRGEVYLRDEARTLEPNGVASIAPRERYSQAGVGYGELFAAYFRWNEQRDDSPIFAYDQQESSLQLRSGFSFGSSSLVAIADVGTTRDRVLKSSGPTRRLQVNCGFTPGARQSYGVGVELAREPILFTGENTDRISGTFHATLFPASGTRIIAGLFATRTSGGATQSYTLADASVEQIVFRDHRITLRARHTLFSPSTDRATVSFMLDYSIPFTVALSKSTSTGTIRGSVVDRGTGAGVKDVVLYAGGAAVVTDASGTFVFPPLAADVYALQCDLGSAGAGLVTDVPLPVNVTVRGGEESRMELSVERGATVSGKVVRRDSSSADSVVRLTPQPGLLVECAGPSGVIRRLTDQAGRFMFSGLPSGSWTITLGAESIPAQLSMLQDESMVSISPGETREVLIRLVPKSRRVRILREEKIEVVPYKQGSQTPVR